METEQVWDETSRLVAEIDDHGNTTSYAYNPLNQMISTTYADGTSESRTFDVPGRRTLWTDANGSTGEITRDRAGRPVSSIVTSTSGAVVSVGAQTLTYDGLSRLVWAEDADTTVSMGYDSLSNLTRETLGGLATTSVYDGVGNEIALTYPGGRTISLAYDELNRISSISDGGTTASLPAYSYTGRGRVARRDFLNGTRWALEYDGLNNAPGDFGERQVTRSTHSVIGGGPVVDDRSFTWDPNGNKKSMTDERLGLPRVFTYDSADRLIASVGGPAGTVSYELDGVGNRGYVTGGPDTGLYVQDPTAPDPLDFQMNQYTSTPLAGQTAQTRLHDLNGNVTSMPFHDQAAGTVVQATATYDNHNQMVQYVRPGVLAEYRYDPLGRRAAKTLHDDTGSTPTVTTTFYLYNGDRVIEEREAEGTAAQGAAGLAVAATYVYGNGIDEVLSMRRELPDGGGGTAPADVYYHSDDQGTIWAVSDGAAAVAERYDYEDYGRTYVLSPLGAARPESGIGNPYRYTGRRFDPESGLYWYRTRYLDPRAGRFTSRDTIGIWGDPTNLGNGFTYVGNNPWTWVDPYGEDPIIYTIVKIKETVLELRKIRTKWNDRLPGENNRIDAKRHAEGSREVKQRYGEFFARMFGIGNEISRFDKEVIGNDKYSKAGYYFDSMIMDLVNNERGFRCAPDDIIDPNDLYVPEKWDKNNDKSPEEPNPEDEPGDDPDPEGEPPGPFDDPAGPMHGKPEQPNPDSPQDSGGTDGGPSFSDLMGLIP